MTSLDKISDLSTNPDAAPAVVENGPKLVSTLRRVGLYAAVRIITISITIVFGVLFAIIVANKGGGIDDSIEAELYRQARADVWNQDYTFEERWAAIDARHAELIAQSPLNDPFLIRHLRWTWNALKLDLGDTIRTSLRVAGVSSDQRQDIRLIILDRMPNTLALVGLADLLVFTIGIPLSLYLSRNYGSWFDKLTNLLSPLSSVPSWVHGILLILIFAVILKILPPGGMIDNPVPDTRTAYFFSRLKHMILPTLAIFLSLLFQLVYTWRNYFMIYSNEDYVELAVAQGLSTHDIQNKYILRPAMPFVLTSFALTLVSFWQMATALEIVFNWDGIGYLYIKSLPHFWGESMFPGEVGLTIGIVVIFAYLLGLIVLLLDVAYAIVDPRIRLGGQQQRVRPTRFKRRVDSRKALLASGMLVIGFLAGMLIGWTVWPVQYTDAAPSDLHTNFQEMYGKMLVDSFLVNQDSGLAATRLSALGEYSASTFGALISKSAEEPALQEQLAAFAAGYQPDAPLVELGSTGSNSTVERSPNSRMLIQILLITVGGLVLITGLFIFGRWVLNKLKEGKSSGSDDLAHKRPSRLANTVREMMRYRSAVAGLAILIVMVSGSLFAVIRYPYREIGEYWSIDAFKNSNYIPQTAYPSWINIFRVNDLPETIIIDSQASPEVKSVNFTDSGNPDYTFTLQFDYPYVGFPTEVTLFFDVQDAQKEPFATFVWTTPNGREFNLKNAAISSNERYILADNLDRRQLADHQISYTVQENENVGNPLLYGLFQNPESSEAKAVQGTYTLEVKVLGFDPDTEVDVEMVILGQVYGAAGTDFYRRDLTVPLLWGMPFALVIGLFGALLTTVVSMLFAAFGVWFGGWADNLVQRVTEANMILPVVAIAVLFYAFYGASLWTILTIIVILNAFGSPTKTFRAAFLQIKDASYIEAAQAYGAPNRRIILRYMIPRILPVLIPQLVTLIPGFIFLEATLGMFNVKSNLPTWGKVIYEALAHGAAWGSKFWVLEPIALLLLTGFAFSMMGFALDRVLNPRLQQGD